MNKSYIQMLEDYLSGKKSVIDLCDEKGLTTGRMKEILRNTISAIRFHLYFDERFITRILKGNHEEYLKDVQKYKILIAGKNMVDKAIEIRKEFDRDLMAWELYKANTSYQGFMANPKTCFERVDKFLKELENQKL